MIQPLSDALAERGYDALTPVQAAVTDPALNGADLLVSAQTGSGKTVAFGLAIGPTLLGDAATLDPAAAPLALIVAPTRELAVQVTRELGWLYARTGARLATCVGGMDMRDERRALERGAHIVVGTPGRLTDHIRRGSLDMTGLRVIVLDEADEMLDLGFREDLEFMLGEAPADRRTLLFSATVPPIIADLARSYQRDAVRVTTLSDRTQHADIAYQVVRVAPQDSETAIINVLRFHEAQNALVFANTRATVNRLAARFANRGFAVVSLSGELSQAERTHALQAMRDGRARVCVATDVAARGIDLPNLDLVVHAELPTNAETLLHRSGRTGRAGRKGLSALIVPPKAMRLAERLLRTARVTAEWTTAPAADEIRRRDEERLLEDPAWSDGLAEDEAAFADRLLALHGPRAIAAACLRFYRARQSAPEELSDPAAPAPARDRAPFGPGVWFTLSVGREARAEARWILPLLCRAGRIGKDAIGAIRVRDSETHVELAEAAVPGFLAALGPDGTLEDGITARRMDAPPDAAAAPAPPKRPPARKATPDAAQDAPAAPPPPPPPAVEDPPPRPAAAPRPPEAAPDAPAAGRRDDGPRPAPADRPKDRPHQPPRAQPADKPARADKRPRHGADRTGDAADTRAKGKPARPDRGPRGTDDRAPWQKRPPRASDPRPDRSGDASPRKGAFGGAKPARAPAPPAPRQDASDTSRRFEPPGRASPAAKPAGRPGGKGPGGKGPGNRGPGGKGPGGKGPRPGGPPRGRKG
jgi:ATP-dependent RNA helicase DeaD